MDQAGVFDLSDHLEHLSVAGDPLEILSGCVDFEFFRETLDAGLKYSRSKRGGPPPYDPVAMLTVDTPKNLKLMRL